MPPKKGTKEYQNEIVRVHYGINNQTLGVQSVWRHAAVSWPRCLLVTTLGTNVLLEISLTRTRCPLSSTLPAFSRCPWMLRIIHL